MSRSTVPLWNSVTPSPDSSSSDEIAAAAAAADADDGLALADKFKPEILIFFFGNAVAFVAGLGVGPEGEPGVHMGNKKKKNPILLPMLARKKWCGF